MPRVSQHPPTKEVQERMRDALFRVLTSITDRVLLEKFVRDLLTPSEQIMIAKRLMASILLQKGYTQSSICSTLRLSRTTVNIIQRELLKGGDGYKTVYVNLFRALKEPQEKRRDPAEMIETWLSAFHLPIKGSRTDMRRWKRALDRI